MCPYLGQLCDFIVISHRGTRSISQGKAEGLGKTDTADVKEECALHRARPRPPTASLECCASVKSRAACWAPGSAPSPRQPYLQPDAAGNGQGVAVLVVELDVANECLIHSSGMAGGQGVEFGLQRKSASTL